MNNIITLSGDPGSGKSTVRKALQTIFEEQGKKVRVYCVGDIFRKLAEDRGMTVIEFSKMLEEKNTSVDEQLDKAVAEYGEKIQSENNPEKIYIIDSRMAWNTIPSAYKVRLTVTNQIAGERIFKDKTRGEEDKYSTIKEAICATKARKESARKRYLELYGKDITLDENFDININTAFVTPEEIASTIISNMNLENRDINKGRIWASPKIFLPTQALGDTIHTYESVRKSIEQNGYDAKQTICATKRGGMYFLIDGHHRNFASASAGINLIPYSVREDTMKDLYTVEEQKDILRNILGKGYRSVLYSYEEAWRDKDTGKLTYRYNDAYPGIYGQQQDVDLKEKDNWER